MFKKIDNLKVYDIERTTHVMIINVTMNNDASYGHSALKIDDNHWVKKDREFLEGIHVCLI